MTIKEGDTVLLRPSKTTEPLYVAKIDKILKARNREVKFTARWYFRPEDTKLGRRKFNGANEVYRSDYCEDQSVNTIERKCKVHLDSKYTELYSVGPDDNMSPRCLRPTKSLCSASVRCQTTPMSLWCNTINVMSEMAMEEAEQLDHFYCDGCDSQHQELPKGLQEEIFYPSRDDRHHASVSLKDLKCLEPREYLSSSIMNFYIRFLLQQFSASQISADCHFFNTFFYKKLIDAVAYKRNDKDAIVNLRRWWEGINLFSKAYIFIPIHDDLHWSLVIVCIPDKENESELTILHLDSLKLHSRSSVFVDNVKWLLEHEWKYLNQDDYSLNQLVSEKGWGNLPCMVSEADIQVPQQMNGYDCGLFVLLFIERFIEDAPQRLKRKDLAMFEKTRFTPDEASALRTKIRKTLNDLFRVRNQADCHNDQTDQTCLQKKTNPEHMIEYVGKQTRKQQLTFSLPESGDTENRCKGKSAVSGKRRGRTAAQKK